MARPSKLTVNTIPFSVDFFENQDMVCIAGEFGVKGEISALKLLLAVHQNGYFLKWSEYQRALMIRLLPGVSPELLDQIISRLLKWGFFHEGLFRSAKILTSVNIQRNYFKAIKRRKGLNRQSFPYLLVDPEHPNKVFADNNGVFACNNSINVSNNPVNVDENEVYVIQNSGNYKKETGSYSDFKGTNDAKNELLHTQTGINVNNNSGLCIQKPKEAENNNTKNASETGVNVCNNADNVNNNSIIANNEEDSDSNNPANIIYNSIYNHHHHQHHLLHQESDSNVEIGKQKGKESLQELELDLSQLQKEEIWIDGFCKNHNIQKNQLPGLLEKFKVHCISEGKTDHIDYQDTKSHFGNWLRMHQKNQNTTAKNYGSKEIQQGSKNRRRGTPANCKKEKNYYESF